MQGALVATWKNPVRGREDMAYEHLEQQREQLQGRAEVQAVRAFYNVTGNHVTGTMLIEGDTAQLARLLGEERFVQGSIRSQALFEEWTTSLFYGGEQPEEAQQQIRKIYSEASAAV